VPLAIVPQTAGELDLESRPIAERSGGAVDSKPTPLPSEPAQSSVASPAILADFDLGGQVSPSVPSVGDDSPALDADSAPLASAPSDAAPSAFGPLDSATSPNVEKTSPGFAVTASPANVPTQFLDFLPQIETASQPAMIPARLVPVAASTVTPSNPKLAAKLTAAITDPIAALTQAPTILPKSAVTGAEAPLIVAGEKTLPGKTADPLVMPASRSFAEMQVAYTVPSGPTSIHTPSTVSTDDSSVALRTNPQAQQPMAPAGEIHPKNNSGASTAESASVTIGNTTFQVNDSGNAAIGPAVPAASFVAAPSSPAEGSVLPPTSQASSNAGQLSPATSPKLDAPQPPAAGTGPVQMARLVNGITQSEMHIGLRTQAFGNVELHTVVRDSQLGLAVGSEKGNLRGFLNSEIPTLQASLGQHDIRFEGIRFLGNGAGVGNGFSGETEQQHSGSFNQANSTAKTDPAANDLQEVSLEEEISAQGNSKISVLA
jgi:hypothetical protein